jgi:DNA modification methylase
VKPFFERDGIVLYHGKAEQVLPTLPAGSVDLVVTSPPYNLGRTHNGTFNHDMRNVAGPRKGSKWHAPALAYGYDSDDDALPHDAYLTLHRGILAECWRTLSPAGAIFYVHKPRIQDKQVWLPLELNPGLPMRQVIIWKHQGFNMSATHLCPTCDWIMVLARRDWALASQSASGFGDVWEIPVDTEADHPAPFPLALAKRAIVASAPATVLDPYAGSGTTLRAALDLGLPAIGIEQSERYCEIAARRLSQLVLPLGAG